MRPVILAIEDHEEMRKIMVAMLGHYGFHVVGAGTLREAAAKLDPKPDLIVLDIELPDGNGWDLVGRVRQFHPQSDLPIVVVSGLKKPYEMPANVQGYFEKPVTFSKLAAHIAGLLKKDVETK